MQTILLVFRSNSNIMLDNNDCPLNEGNKNNTENSVNKYVSDNFEFPLDINDTILVLTINNSRYKENVGNIISKMMVIKELKYVNLDSFSAMLGHMGMEELNIFSIYDKLDIQPKNIFTNKGCKVRYMEVKLNVFTEFLNIENKNFFDYNQNCLYIIRGGNYIDIKNIFASINNQECNLGR